MGLSDNIAAIASLANIFATLFGGFIFLMSVQRRQAEQGVMIKSLSKAVDRLEQTIEDMRRGNGWIKHPLRTSVDGEY